MFNTPQIQETKPTRRTSTEVAVKFFLAVGIFFAYLAAVRLAPLLFFAMASFGVSWDSMFFLPQVAFPNDYINRAVAAENHIPTVTIAFWLFVCLAFAAFTTRREIWQLLLFAPAVIYVAAYAFAYGLRLFGIQIQLDGL